MRLIHFKTRLSILLLAAIAASVGRLCLADDWPQFRGLNRDGISLEKDLLQDWPEIGPPKVWRKSIGLGWGSFAIANGRAYTVEQRDGNETIACYDMATGGELWTHAYPAKFFEKTGGGEGPRSTPTLDGARLHVLGAEGELTCLDARSGTRIWSVSILKENGMGNLTWGLAGSPLIEGENVYITASGSEMKPAFFAFDKTSGKLIFKTQNYKHSYASLVAADIAGVRLILSFSAGALNGIDPAEGKLRWKFDWPMTNDVNAAQPMPIGGDRIFISSGWGRGCAMVKIAGSSPNQKAEIVWKNLNMKNRFNSSIFTDGLIFGLDEGIMTCIDPGTGKRKWKGGRYGLGQMIHAGRNFIIVSEDGDLALVRASKEKHDEVARFHVFDSTTWNVPALANGLLLVRNDREMVCYDLRPKDATP